jgi:hypothetical protein
VRRRAGQRASADRTTRTGVNGIATGANRTDHVAYVSKWHGIVMSPSRDCLDSYALFWMIFTFFQPYHTSPEYHGCRWLDNGRRLVSTMIAPAKQSMTFVFIQCASDHLQLGSPLDSPNNVLSVPYAQMGNCLPPGDLCHPRRPSVKSCRS